ncbi:MAG TPA: hypothetical protein VKV40_15705 [Ktedonobacteraceae bacterium]|nr:hypothetical protein [Ktedonobacteraceae bacterium]
MAAIAPPVLFVGELPWPPEHSATIKWLEVEAMSYVEINVYQ